MGPDELRRNGVQVLVDAADRLVAEGAAGQDQGLGAGAGREGEEGVKVPVPGGLRLGVEHGVQVPDVPVDRTDPQPRGDDVGRHGGDGRGVEVVGDVVAHAGQGAEVDFLEAQAADGAQGRGQVLVPEADGRAAESGIEHRR